MFYTCACVAVSMCYGWLLGIGVEVSGVEVSGVECVAMEGKWVISWSIVPP